MGKLTNKNELVIGGATSIGFVTGQMFLSEGSRLAITGQNAERLESAAESLDCDVLALQTDQTSLTGSDQLVVGVSDAFGSLDTVFRNAGITLPAPIKRVTEDQFEHLYRTNLKGPFFSLPKLIPVLSEKATVVLNGYMWVPTKSAYAAAKRALAFFARGFVAALLPNNAVTLGPVAPPSIGKLGLRDDQPEGLRQQLTSAIPMCRVGQVDEIAIAVLFLATTVRLS